MRNHTCRFRDLGVQVSKCRRAVRGRRDGPAVSGVAVGICPRAFWRLQSRAVVRPSDSYLIIGGWNFCTLFL